MALLDIDKYQFVLLGISCIGTIVLIGYYLRFFTGFSKLSQPKREQSTTPVSVIIAAKNERENLKENLPSILSQDYPNFEVVVVNDGSYDGTKDYLKELAVQHSNLKIVTLEIDERFRKGKKFAITMGTKAATNENLLFTDADCKPMSNKWISSMAPSFENKDILLGYAPLKVIKTPLGSLISFETFHTALQYLGYAKNGQTFMGVGRNLGYKKSLFFANKGFAKHQHILSGDDDLFIQQIANKSNVATIINPDSFMLSDAPKGILAWIKQKIRHLSTATEYKQSSKWLLGIYSLAHLTTYISLIVFSALYPDYWILSLIIISFKWIVQWFIMFKPARLLNANKIAFALPYYDLLYTVYLFLFALLKPFLKPKTWS